MSRHKIKEISRLCFNAYKEKFLDSWSKDEIFSPGQRFPYKVEDKKLS